MKKEYNYYGFLSHRSIDKDFALWLQKKIEGYTIPKSFRNQPNIKTKQIKNLCLDVASFSGSELKEEVNRKLEMSDKLILICSHASASPIPEKEDWTNYADSVDWLAEPSETGWVGYEIVKFLEYHEYKDIIPVVIDGDPIARDCFHPYLNKNFIETDLLKWHDFREPNRKDRKNLLRLIAAILSIENLDDFIKRDTIKRRVKMASLAAGAAAVIAGAVFAADYFIPHTAHYSDYTLVKGIPQGIGTISNDEKANAHYIITTNKSNKTTTLQHVNSHGVETEDEDDHHIDTPMIAVYKCRDSGNVDTIEYKDRNGVSLMTYAYTTDMKYVSFQENEYTSDQVYPVATENEYGIPVRLKIDRYEQEYDDNGYISKRRYMSGVNYVVDETGVAGETYKYDSNGRLIELKYINSSGNDVANLNGVAGYTIEYDSQGRQSIKSYRKKDGSFTYGPEGYASRTTYYSEEGLLAKQEYLDAKGAFVINRDGYAIADYQYNSSRDKISVAYYDSKQSPVYCGMGYHKTTLDYNERGDVIKQAFYNDKSAPVICKDGYAAIEKEYDNRSNVIKISYLDNEGNPYSSNRRPSTILYEVDSNGCITKETNVDENGNNTFTEDGYSIKKVELDGFERPVSISYYDLNEEPIYLKDGYHKLQFSYNERGNLIEVRALGTKDQLVPFSGYWAIQKMTYNGGGYVTNVSYENQFGQPVVIKGGYASIENSYDDAGYLLSSTYYDATGKPCSAIGGVIGTNKVVIDDRLYAKIEFEYDEFGNVVKETHYDEDGGLSKHEASPMLENICDESGRVLELLNYDSNGQLVSVGSAKVQYKYDEYGNKVETKCFDSTGAPVDMVTNGIHKVINEYDFRGNLIRQEKYNKDSQLVDGYKLKIQYDDNGLKEKEEYFDIDDNPYVKKEGYSKVSYEYNEYHDESIITYLDKNGNPVNCIYGFSKAVYTYDNKHNLAGREYFDKDGNPADNTARGYAKSIEVFNDWYYPTSSCLYDKTGQLLLKYEAEYIDHGYKSSEALYGSDGELLNNTMDGVAKCTYEYDAYHNCVGGAFYGEDGEPKEIGKIASYYSEYENGMETLRVYYDANNEKSIIAEGFSSVKFTYDEYGREIIREFFDNNDKPIDTVFGFQKYIIEYSDQNEIIGYTFYDSKDNKLDNIKGSVRIVTLNLGGDLDYHKEIDVASVKNVTRVTRVAYEENGHYDLMLAPKTNLQSHYYVTTIDLINKSRKRIIPSTDGESIDLSKYGEANQWIAVLDQYTKSVKTADLDAFLKILMTDYLTAGLEYYNSSLNTEVTEQEYFDYIKEFYREEIEQYNAMLKSKYGNNIDISYEIIGIETATKADIDSINDKLTAMGSGNAATGDKVSDFVVLTIRFTCKGEIGEGKENTSFLFPAQPLMKIGNKWKLGSSNDFPSPGTKQIEAFFKGKTK